MVGVSVGLGNVWRFPYMMGKFGGSAFLVIYLVFTLLFAIPAMMAEWALGRETRQGPVGAFAAAFGSTTGRAVGFLLLFTVLVANSYYLVVIANVVYTAVVSAAVGFGNTDLELFDEGLRHGGIQYALALATLLAALYVIDRGLQGGIERVSKWFVPFFTLVMFYLVFSAFSLEGAVDQVRAFLRPDFSALQAKHVFAALGQAFFSLGLGGTFLVIYGSYLRPEQKLPRSAVVTALGDAGAAVLASLFIVPSILVFGLDLTQGPTLLFSTLPRLFAVMPAGRLLGSAFLLALTAVAFLSTVAALEVLVGGLNDLAPGRLRRRKIVLFVGLVEAGLILPSALQPDIIGTLDLVFGSGMQVFGSALAVIGVGWALGRTAVLRQVFGRTLGLQPQAYLLWIRWVVPAALLYILFNYVYSG